MNFSKKLQLPLGIIPLSIQEKLQLPFGTIPLSIHFLILLKTFNVISVKHTEYFHSCKGLFYSIDQPTLCYLPSEPL